MQVLMFSQHLPDDFRMHKCQLCAWEDVTESTRNVAGHKHQEGLLTVKRRNHLEADI